MCFSATASFGASIVLGTIGVVTLKKVKVQKQVPFAFIPILFATQQFSEGLLWIGLSDPTLHSSWQNFPVYIFLIFAQILWPVWIPFSVVLLEEHKVRKRILQILVGIGLLISIYLLYCLFVYDVSAEISSGHVHYNLNFPLAFAWLSSILYFMPTVFSLFISSVKRMPLLGTAILVSFILTKIFFEEYLISVWCFFAALISIIVLAIIAKFSIRDFNPNRFRRS